MKKIINKGKTLPLKNRIFLGMVASLIGIIFTVAFTFAVFYSYLNVFSRILAESDINQNLSSAFSQVHDTFQDYIWHQDDHEAKSNWEAACDKMEEELQKLPTDYNQIGLQRYLKTMSVIHGYEGYQKECNAMLKTSPDNDLFLKHLNKCNLIADYIQLYIDRLIDVTLNDGLTQYQHKITHMQILPYIWILLGILILVCVYFFGKTSIILEDLRKKAVYEQQLHEKELLHIQAEQTLNEIRLRLLQSQINPHFLFNTLNLIASMAKIEDADNTTEMIHRLSNIFRYNLKEQKSTTSLLSEITIAKDYFYIQQRRFGSRVQLQWDIQSDPSEIFLPSFTLQPLLENAVIHGISPKSQGGVIRIRFFQRNSMNHLHITDNGIGISDERLKEIKDKIKKPDDIGIGVSNVRSRFETLYPNSCFRIRSKFASGTTISILWKPQTPTNAEKGELPCGTFSSQTMKS